MEEPWGEIIGSVVLGTRAFIQSLRDRAKATSPLRERLRRRPTWPEIVSAVERVRGEAWKEFAQRHGDFGRDLALYLGRTTGSMTLQALGKAAAGMKVMAVSLAIKRLGNRLKTDEPLRKAKAAAEKQLLKV